MSPDRRIASIKAVLFDMDGLLIDSEGIYTKVVNDILRPYGKEQTWAIKANLMGKPEREATYTLLSSLWPPSPDHPELQFSPDCPFTIDTFLADRNLNLEEEFSKVPPMPGAQRLVEHLERCGVPICVATGSKRRNFEIKTAHNGPLFSPFRDRIICGDDSRLSRGKPNPDVFLLAAREGLFAGEREGSETHQKLGSGWVDSIRELGEENDSKGFKGGEAQVLVFEDAKPGVQAALAAGMNVVWVPDANLRALYPNEELGATQTIGSLLDFDPTDWGLPPFPLKN